MSEKNNVTANNEQTALTTGGFAALANAGALNDATEIWQVLISPLTG